MLTTSAFMFLFKSLDHLSDPRYLKPNILAFFDSPRLAQKDTFEYFVIRVKVVGFRDSISNR